MSSAFHPLNNKQLLEALSFSKDATAIHISENAVIQYANDAMLAFWGKGKSVIGKPLAEALPELAGQPFVEMFKRVWLEGTTIAGTDTPAQLKINGELKTFYFDFEYKPIKDEQGKVLCILNTATEVTQRVLSAEREQALTEELKSANEELLAINEELNATNEELNNSQQNLRKLYEELSESNTRFRSVVKQAPIGICIIRANDLLVQEVNDSCLELIGKNRSEVENHTIWKAVPEAAEYYAPILDEVIKSGMPYIAKEHEVLLIRHRFAETIFVDFVYEPMIRGGTVSEVLVLVIEVTDKVIARRNIEEMEERARLSIEAADLGTFDYDLVNKILLTSDRFNSIFGFDRTVPWETFAAAIHPDDRSIREQAYKEALQNQHLFYEARVIHKDGSIHWIRVQGRVYLDKDAKPLRMLGTLLDITQFKLLQQQKDDFISIASHELKTPITSLKTSLQLLDRMKDNTSQEMFPKLIAQSRKSVQKISLLVDDLLNLGRLQKGKLTLNKSNFIISELINSCCNPMSIAGKQIIITGDKKLQIYADEHRIDQVVTNLVNNAIKYAPASKSILLTISKEKTFAKVAITDTGPGIPANKIPNLFNRYYQIDNLKYQNSGLGLGLYISAEIVRRHGGEIGVESKVGEGSTFWFTLPLK